MFDVHTENVIGALVKCILQPTKDKTVTGKLSCLSMSEVVMCSEP